jgi:hypothetical protein
MTMRQLFRIQSLLWLALVLALVGSLRHVAWGFSTLEQGDLVAGYVQAVAVDIGLFALAVGIQQRRRQGRPSRGLWAGVVLFSAVSTYANLLHGLAFASDIGLAEWAWLVFARPFVLSAVLPILVVYLSEVAASDANHALAEAERERRKAGRQSSITTGIVPSAEQAERARAVKAERDRLSKTAALGALLTVYQTDPNASMAQAGRAIGRSKTTVATYLDELEQAGRVHRNGDGVRVLEG